MFKTSMTQDLYDEFIAELSLEDRQVANSPFVLVDPEDGSIKLLSGIVEGEETNSFLAYTIAAEGNLEVLSAEGEE